MLLLIACLLAAAVRGESFDELMQRAIAAMQKGDLNESIAWLDRAAALRPESPEVYRVLGLDYTLGGMLKQSEQAFRRGAELDPRSWELRYLHGRALYEMGSWRESEKALRAALELMPSSVRAWTALGQVQERLDRPGEAAENYRQGASLCIKSSAECSWPLFQLGFLALRQDGPEQAAEYFRRAIASRPDWAKPHFYLGKALASLEDLAGARVEMEAAVRLDGGRAEYHYQLAQVCRRLGDVVQAQHHMERYRALSQRMP